MLSINLDLGGGGRDKGLSYINSNLNLQICLIRKLLNVCVELLRSVFTFSFFLDRRAVVDGQARPPACWLASLDFNNQKFDPYYKRKVFEIVGGGGGGKAGSLGVGGGSVRYAIPTTRVSFGNSSKKHLGEF